MLKYAVYLFLIAVLLAVIFLDQVTYLDGLFLVFSVLGSLFVVSGILDEGGIESQFERPTEQKQGLKHYFAVGIGFLLFSGLPLWGGVSFLLEPQEVYLSRYGGVHNWSGGILLVLCGLFLPALLTRRAIAQKSN